MARALGLPIVLEVARQHGGQVVLEDAHPGRATGRTLQRALHGTALAAAA